ncbi:MAG: CocE/NonD family hydrolase C-terminal non-catalytic domain-containing protein [Planctomycetaceae bacterium]
MFLSSTAKDTDVIVRVSDVYPDGRSILIVDYPWRVRYREGFGHENVDGAGTGLSSCFPGRMDESD